MTLLKTTFGLIAVAFGACMAVFVIISIPPTLYTYMLSTAFGAVFAVVFIVIAIPALILCFSLSKRAARTIPRDEPRQRYALPPTDDAPRRLAHPRYSALPVPEAQPARTPRQLTPPAWDIPALYEGLDDDFFGLD